MSEATFEGVHLTESAIKQLKLVLASEPETETRLRLFVEPGGCSGLRYQFFTDENTDDKDTIFPFDGVEVVIDNKSLPYLAGATLDWEDSIMSQRFVIDNPNAQDTCACGDSFN